MNPIDRYEWRYLPGGAVTHALETPEDLAPQCASDSDIENRVAWALARSSWRGTGSQSEYEHAAVLPRCKRCLRAIGVAGNA